MDEVGGECKAVDGPVSHGPAKKESRFVLCFDGEDSAVLYLRVQCVVDRSRRFSCE